MARTRQSRLRTSATAFVVQEGESVAGCVFTDRNAAETHCRERNHSLRAWANPFEWGGDPKKCVTGGVSRFRKSLKALRVPEPSRGQEWRDWWEAVCPQITVEQRDAVWDLLDKYQYFVVVEVPLEE